MTMIPNKKDRIPWVTSILMLALAMPGIAQKNFNMNEKEMVRDFKLSNSHFLKGQKLFKKGQTEKAVASMQECLRIFPRHDKAHLVMAGIYLKQRKLAEAETEIIAAKKGFEFLQKWYAFTYQEYMNSLRGRKDAIDKQIVTHLAAISQVSRPGQKSMYENKIQQLKTEKTAIDSRLNEFMRTGVQMPANYHYIHGNILFLSRQFRQAMSEYTLTVEKDPKNGGAFHNMANIYFMMKQYDKARESLTKAEACGIKVNPKFLEALEKAEGQ